MRKITTAAVIGAGSMGSGIAAHLANAGIKVLLLDVPADDHSDRNARAKEGIERQLHRRGFMRTEFAERVTPGNIDDDLAKLSETDWVVEAIVEDPAIKRDLYAKLAANVGEQTVLSSNTSTIPLSKLVEGMNQDLRSRFAIIHFFNPPRVMRLVELVSRPETKTEVIDLLQQVCEQQLGKVVLHCRDTPGFIANRIGNLWMAAGASIALRHDVAFEDADAAFGKPFGVPRTGIFGLFDYIGIQLVPAIWRSLENALPEDDAYNRFRLSEHPLFHGLLERGWTGRTGPSGFYRGRDEVVTEDFDYRPRQQSDDPALAEKTARNVMSTNSSAGRFARETYLETLRYCCNTAAEIADTVADIDTAMVQGYGWKQGPFALADSIGIEWIADQYETAPELLRTAVETGGFYPAPGTTLSSTGEAVGICDPEGVITLAEATSEAETVFSNDGAAVHLRPDGVAVLDLKTPLNSCSVDVLAAIAELADKGQNWGVEAVVIGNDEARAFSAGADLATLARLSQEGDTEGITRLLTQGREAMASLYRAPFPVVAAARGIALGGGAELLLHSDARVIAAETKIGFPERNVGLIPGWGGTIRILEALQRSGAIDPVQTSYDFIMSAKPVPTAFDAKALGILGKDDRILLSPDHVLGEAIELALSLKGSYQPPESGHFQLSSGDDASLSGKWHGDDASATDTRIAEALARVYEADSATEADLGQRETREAAELLSHPNNSARAEHMARTRKPLKN